ncbi:MAG: hypothetical protein HRU20_03025 [Pseudomonadales bacterium]|nr:hypothetical protein [Pseudomonadales bacterium]
MTYLAQQFYKFSQWRFALLSVLLLAGLLHCGTSFNGGFYADDYFQRSYVIGSDALAEKGFFDGMEVGSFNNFVKNQFLFFDPALANYDALLDFGVLPWWMHEDTKLHFFRPLSAALHFVEYSLFPDSPQWMHLISLFWYLAGLAIIYRLYLAVGIKQSIGLFALLLLVLDNSIFHILPWIAARNMLLIIVFGFGAVYAYHRAVQDWRWHIAGVTLLSLSLLAGEGGVGICMYLGAYLFTLDTRAWTVRIAAIMPYVLVTIIWRLYYQTNGYGAFGADLYIDPGHDPVSFLSRALWQYPGNFFELAAGIDTLSGQVRSDIRQNFAFVGVAVFAVITYLLRQPLKTDKTLRFFYLATLFAIVPGLAVALSSRVMILPFIGFAVVLATLFYQMAKGAYQGLEKYLAASIIIYSLLMHVIAGFALAVFMTYSILDFSGEGAMKRGGVDLGVDDIANKTVVIINAQKPFWLAFVAHELDYAEQELPNHVRVLASSFHAITVTRKSDTQLLLTAEPGFQLDSKPVFDITTQVAGHYAYLSQHLMGLTRHRDTPWQVGMQRDFSDIKIEISTLYEYEGRAVPKTLLVTLKQSLTSYRFSYWDVDASIYQTFTLPEVGRSVEVKGIFTLSR